MISKNPTISVIMPVYNAEDYLKEAVQSILDQTYKNFEFLIINDGSTDGSEEVILSFSDERIKYIKNDENLQIVKTLNKGITLAKGNYIARMDSDDISLPNRFEKQLSFMKNNDVDVCGSWIKTVGYKNELWKFPQAHEAIKATLLFNSAIFHPSVMIKKEVFNIFKYEEQYNKAEDYALRVKTIEHFTFANIPEVLLHYRIHENQTNKIVQVKKANEIRILMLKKFLKDLTDKNITDFLMFANNEKIKFEELEEILNKIIIENKRIQYNTEEIFYSILSKRLLVLVSLNSKKCISNFYKLKKSSLDTSLKIPKLLYLKQLIKCIIGFYSGR